MVVRNRQPLKDTRTTVKEDSRLSRLLVIKEDEELGRYHGRDKDNKGLRRKW